MHCVAVESIYIVRSHIIYKNERADGVKKKKNKTRIRNICILIALIAVAVIAYNVASGDEYAETREAVLAKYLSYEDASAVTYNAYVSQFGKAYVDDKASNITLKATDYSEADMDGIKEEGGVVWIIRTRPAHNLYCAMCM